MLFFLAQSHASRCATAFATQTRAFGSLLLCFDLSIPRPHEQFSLVMAKLNKIESPESSQLLDQAKMNDEPDKKMHWTASSTTFRK